MKMNGMKRVGLAMAAVVALMGTQTTPLHAAPAKSMNKEVVADMVSLIDVAGRQRMLSQRIAKDYLYVGKK